MAKIVVLTKNMLPDNVKITEHEEVYLIGKANEKISLMPAQLEMLAKAKLHFSYVESNDAMALGYAVGLLAGKLPGKVEVIGVNGMLPGTSATPVRRRKKEEPKEEKAEEHTVDAPVQKKKVPKSSVQEAVSAEKKPRKQKNIAGEKGGAPDVNRHGSAVGRTYAKSVKEVEDTLAAGKFDKKYAPIIYEVMQTASDVTLDMMIRVKLSENGASPEECNDISLSICRKYGI